MVTTPFGQELIATVATEYDIGPADLERLATTLQAFVEDYEAVGGVDGLVYEWRQSFAVDPLYERRPDRYYLVVEHRVWNGFAERLEFSDNELTALQSLHEATFVAECDDAPAGQPLVLSRPDVR